MNWLHNLLVGVLFFGALSLVGFFTIVSESGPFAERGKHMVVFFDNAEGLREGSTVTVLGVPSGVVHSVELVPVNEKKELVEQGAEDQVGQRVAITLELRNDVVFYENYRVAIKNESILSGKVIAIDPGTARDLDNPEQEVPRIPVMTASLSLLSDEGQSAVQYFQSRSGEYETLEGTSAGDPVAGIAELISENRENVRQTIENVKEITRKVNEGEGTLGQLVNNDELHRNANTLVTDAQTVVKELRESLEDTREQAPVTSFVRAALTAF